MWFKTIIVIKMKKIKKSHIKKKTMKKDLATSIVMKATSVLTNTNHKLMNVKIP